MTSNFLTSCVQQRRREPATQSQLDALPDLVLDIVIRRLDSADCDSLVEAAASVRPVVQASRRVETSLRRALAAAPDAPAIKRELAARPQVAAQLRWLDLQGHKLGAAGVVTVSRALREHCPALKRLSLAENGIEDIDTRAWELPDGLTVLNLSGNPRMLAADAPMWKLPEGVQGLNLAGVPLPRAWQDQAFAPSSLRLLQWHADEQALGYENADPALRHHTCGPLMGTARHIITHPVTHILTYAVGVYGLSRGVMAQLPPLYDEENHHWNWTTAPAFMFMGTFWNTVQVVSLAMPTTTAMVAAPHRRVALGDVSGCLTAYRDLAAESLFLAGNSLAMASMAPSVLALRLLPVVTWGAPVVATGAAGLLGAIFGLGQLSYMKSHTGVFVAAIVGMFVGGCAAGAVAMPKLVPNYWSRTSAMVAWTNDIRDKGHTYAREKVRTAVAWLVEVPPPVAEEA